MAEAREAAGRRRAWKRRGRVWKAEGPKGVGAMAAAMEVAATAVLETEAAKLAVGTEAAETRAQSRRR